MIMAVYSQEALCYKGICLRSSRKTLRKHSNVCLVFGTESLSAKDCNALLWKKLLICVQLSCEACSESASEES